MSHESLQGSIQIPALLSIFGTELEVRRKLATHTKTVESPVEIRRQTYREVWSAGLVGLVT